MNRFHASRRLLLVTALLAVLVTAGCIQTTELPDDRVESGGPTPAPDGAGVDGDGTDGEGTAGRAAEADRGEDATDGARTGANAPTDRASSATEDGGADEDDAVAPPDAIDDRAVERAVWRRIDAHRDTVGVRDARWSQGLGVEPARAANRKLMERGIAPPALETGSAFASSSRELLERFRDEGVTSCTGLSKDVAGQVSAAVDIRPHSDAANPLDAATTAERIAHHVVKEWRDDPETADVIDGSYRYVGVDARYDAETGSLYLTAALC